MQSGSVVESTNIPPIDIVDNPNLSERERLSAQLPTESVPVAGNWSAFVCHLKCANFGQLAIAKICIFFARYRSGFETLSKYDHNL
jgi:hypothetical protein